MGHYTSTSAKIDVVLWTGKPTMCGIAGVFRSRLTADGIRAALDAMNEAQRYRGPDETGCFVAPELGAGLASRRLSIVDIEHGQQPMPNEDGRVRVVLSGEIYNHVALRDELAARGHRFRSRSDTEVVAHLYEEVGCECLRRLDGMFALGILDLERQTLLLARDRVGMKHLYYGETASGLVFASEAKALFAAGLVKAEPNPFAIDTYLATGYVPAPVSAFQGVARLMPGEYLLAGMRPTRRDFFWRLAYRHEQVSRKDEEYVDELDHLLAGAVRTHLAADVPVGAFLSGGWDSSLTAAYAAEVAGARLKTFSIVFPDSPQMDESRYSRLMARTLGTDHHEIEYRDAGLPAKLSAISRHLDEPVSSAPAGVLFQLASLAAGHVKTTISGEGADELFGGYEWLRLDSPYLLRRLAPKWITRRAALWCSHPRLRRALRVLSASEDRVADAEWRRCFTPEDKQRMLKPECWTGGPDILPVLVPEDVLASCADRIERCLALEIRGRLSDAILFISDKVGMAHSLEVRMPFLDRCVVDFALRLPSRLKVHRGREKIVVQKLAGRRLPAVIAARRKHGLGYPRGAWMKEPLRTFARELLLDGGGRGPFRRVYLEHTLAGPRPRLRDEAMRRLVFLQLWWNGFF
ncbi:MAG: asparagine synthase (glutamine-hydrolyzing) [Acidobacteriales bacterium]|nr:asparagine synthase (glutamine-hydrolyzing) [Terriglobales bacterium]